MSQRTVYSVLGIVVAVVVIVLFFVFILSFNDPRSTSNDPVRKDNKSLAELATNSDSTVVFTSVGEINGAEAHRSIVVSVSSDSRKLDVLKGYQGEVLSSYSFTNNQPAFNEFLEAIDRAGFNSKLANPTQSNIEGQCPLGVRYIFTAKDIEPFPENLWTSSCGKKIGTFGGNLSLVQQLFRLQIPDYSKLTQDVDLQ